jgi:excisionase family DNA binding protein
MCVEANMELEALLFSIKGGAAKLGLGRRTVEYLIAAGELEVRRVGRRVLIPRKALEKFAMRDHPSPRPRAKAPSLREPQGGTAS